MNGMKTFKGMHTLYDSHQKFRKEILNAGAQVLVSNKWMALLRLGVLLFCLLNSFFKMWENIIKKLKKIKEEKFQQGPFSQIKTKVIFVNFKL